MVRVDAGMHSIQEPVLWISFIALVAIVISIDLFVSRGVKIQQVTIRQSVCWTFIWIACALLFNLGLWRYLLHTQPIEFANQKALEFLTGFLIEESLSFDNMFVFLMIFKAFSVPYDYQRRVLFFGVAGAIVMRFLMIYLGTWLVREFFWILYVFGLSLIFIGIKMFIKQEEEKDIRGSRIYQWLRSRIRFTEIYHQENFFVRVNALWYATPLLLVLILIEVSDLIFAFDSIPAIFAITLDPFIVFTSNIFAILGLRAIYFLLANLAKQFDLLKYGVALVLIFIGGKMVLEPLVHIPVLLALGIVSSILATTILLSFIKRDA